MVYFQMENDIDGCSIINKTVNNSIDILKIKYT